MTTERAGMDPQTLAAMQACVAHARHLIESAEAVLRVGRANIAYHLAALAIEEIGKREILGVQSIASAQAVPPAWPERHSQSHVQKLFWAFFSRSFGVEKLTRDSLESMRGLAEVIHSKRLEGLYVGTGGAEGFTAPADAIRSEECEALLRLARAQLAIAESERLRDHIPQEELEEQAWFLRTIDDPEKRKLVLGGKSMTKLAELGNVPAWVKWMQSEFEKAEQEGREELKKELARSKNGRQSDKQKWRIRIRIHSGWHTIRPKEFGQWNRGVDWIKLSGVNDKKNQLLIDFTLGDSVPIEGLWHFGWGLCRHFVVALNIGTMGFFWWHLPQQISRYYESIEDIDKRLMLRVERQPALRMEWGGNKVLTAEDLNNVASVFTALPGPHERSAHGPFNYYIGGLTFLGLNDIHWQCEGQAFENFLRSLQAMMAESGEWNRKAPDAFGSLLDEITSSAFDERDYYIELIQNAAKRRKPGVITLKEAHFMKIFCDSYFLKKLRPRRLERLKKRFEGDARSSGEAT